MGSIAVFIFVLWAKGFLKSDKRIEVSSSPAATFERSVKKIFGVPKNILVSGVASVKYSVDNSEIHYNFFPYGYTEFEKELGNDIVPKIWKLYATKNKFDNIKFIILLPFYRNNFRWRHV